MNTQLATDHLGLPPPLLPRADADTSVGWVRDDTIGFRGFANETDAMAAAWMAHRALMRPLAGPDGAKPSAIPVEPVTLAREGSGETILASDRPIGTLIRPDEDGNSGPESFGFEVHLPEPGDAVATHDTAFRLYDTIRRSGIGWPGKAATLSHEERAPHEEWVHPEHDEATVAPKPKRAHDLSLGATLGRMTILALTLAMVALLTGAFSGSEPIGIAAATIAVVGFGAAAVSEASLRWMPRRPRAARPARLPATRARYIHRQLSLPRF